MTAASERGAGSFGPSDHLSKLPVPEVFAMNVVSTAFEPSDPPTYRSVVPDWTTVPSVRAAGRAISVGEEAHGTTAPTGAGQGSDWLPAAQKFTGLQARIPRSIVLLTVK